MFRLNKDGITTDKGIHWILKYYYGEPMRKAEQAAILALVKAAGIDITTLDKIIDKHKQPPEESTICLEAHHLIMDDRRHEYGPVEIQFQKIATVASIATGKNISAQDIATINIAQKLVRESYKHNRDNLADIAGYAGLKQQVIERRESAMVASVNHEADQQTKEFNKIYKR